MMTMTEEEKSIALAEMAKWELVRYPNGCDAILHYSEGGSGVEMPLEPYKNTISGLAQYGALTIMFPRYMEKFTTDVEGPGGVIKTALCHEPSQAEVLDAILMTYGEKS